MFKFRNQNDFMLTVSKLIGFIISIYITIAITNIFQYASFLGETPLSYFLMQNQSPPFGFLIFGFYLLTLRAIIKLRTIPSEDVEKLPKKRIVDLLVPYFINYPFVLSAVFGLVTIVIPEFVKIENKSVTYVTIFVLGFLADKIWEKLFK